MAGELLNIIPINKVFKILPVGIADGQKGSADLDFVFVNGVDGLECNDERVVDADELIWRERFFEGL